MMFIKPISVMFGFVATAHAYGGNGGGGYGGGNAGGFSTGGGPAVAGFGGGPVTAAVQSTHTVEIRHVNVQQELPQPQIVEVESGNLPLTIHFKSASSALNVLQTHQPGLAAETQHTSSEDEPHRLVHEVTKPVIQEVREIITPFRRVIQEIKPVQEEIQTIIAKGEARPQLGADGGAALSGGAAGFGGAGGAAGFSAGGAGGFSGGAGLGSAGGYGGASLKGGAYAAAASSQPAVVASPRATPSISTKSNERVSYYQDSGNSGLSYASSQASAPASAAKPSQAYSSTSNIRILEGGSSRTSGLSGISAYKSRA